MDVLQAMRAFNCVVQAGSLTGAAEYLDTTTASVSRMLSNLEAHLHIRLLNRTTRRIALTEAGKRYLVRCRLILELVEKAESEVQQQLLDLPATG
ncbi:TPA: LysR family transcriptional regulator [Pseudomonas putida]|nr:LysR family transcriptional regulator [Pseudomonas sp. PNP]PXZ50036.1 LysR family transcriptional regulator [Pseudomonas sp. SMT-1]QDW60808.1 LysR family transcriptional regulator [Pseudomonas sp. KBS0802]QXZ08129.1 LysR family transcriptional regulator [Pseudomonas putida]UZA77389.1 LysR family transcriptional regulator [Pseudomonas putida]